MKNKKVESMWDIMIREGDQKAFKYHGVKCQIIRNTSFNYTWCGYVCIPKVDAHKFHDLDCDLDVHGGVTFTSGSTDDIVLGFDCGHMGDYKPIDPLKQLNLMALSTNGTYRTKEYVIMQVKGMVDQLKR